MLDNTFPIVVEDRPVLMQGDRPVRQALVNRIPDDPEQAIVEPTMLSQWRDANLPFRGELRKRAVSRMVDETRRRRSIDGLATRAAAAAVTPITSEMESLMTERIRDRLNEQAKRTITRGSE